MAVRLSTYHKGDSIPALPGKEVFHSTELFHVYEMTRGYDPVLIVASVDERPVAKLLGVVRRSVRMFPPSIIKRCEVYGSGEYFDEEMDREELFGEMLDHLTNEALRKCFLIEFRNLENSLFGYKMFRKNKYFAINWLRVHNSLHSKHPYDRLNASRKRQINRAQKNGVTTEIAEKEEDIRNFALMLKRTYSSKIRKHFPDIDLFRLLAWQKPEKEMAKIFVVRYEGKIIGGSICMFSEKNAYLWFSGGLKKTYAFCYPGIMAVWAPMMYAYEKGYWHFEFMDAGLPFQKLGYRDFILRFGGMQSSTRRWFRFRWGWLNHLLYHLHI